MNPNLEIYLHEIKINIRKMEYKEILAAIGYLNNCIKVFDEHVADNLIVFEPEDDDMDIVFTLETDEFDFDAFVDDALDQDVIHALDRIEFCETAINMLQEELDRRNAFDV